MEEDTFKRFFISVKKVFPLLSVRVSSITTTKIAPQRTDLKALSLQESKQDTVVTPIIE